MYYKHWTQIPTKSWPWTFFTTKEIASHGDGSIIIVPQALDKLQTLFREMNCPIRINDGYRDPIHNVKVGGAPLSMHKFGKAFDLSFHGLDKQKLYSMARACGFTGIGHYASFLHVDIGRRREWKG